MSVVINQIEEHMKKSIEVTQKGFASIRTGRASPALLDHLQVEYYGTPTPIKQLAGISAPEARLLVIQPYDTGAVLDIERAILKSDLGLSPKVEGGVIRIPIPSLTEERRRDLIKIVKKNAEEGRVAIRNIRREGMDELKKQVASKTLSEDQQKLLEDQIQKLTEKHIKEIDDFLARKEKELLEV